MASDQRLHALVHQLGANIRVCKCRTTSSFKLGDILGDLVAVSLDTMGDPACLPFDILANGSLTFLVGEGRAPSGKLTASKSLI